MTDPTFQLNTPPTPPSGTTSPTGHETPAPDAPGAHGADPYRPASYAPVPYGYRESEPQQYGPQQYGSPQYGARPGTNGLAIASLVLGVLWLYWLGSIVAVVLGHMALRQIKKAPPHQQPEGRGLAIAGIVLGWVGVGVLILIGAFIAAVELGRS